MKVFKMISIGMRAGPAESPNIHEIFREYSRNAKKTAILHLFW